MLCPCNAGTKPVHDRSEAYGITGLSSDGALAAFQKPGNRKVQTHLKFLYLYQLSLLQSCSQPATVESGTECILNRLDTQIQALYLRLLSAQAILQQPRHSLVFAVIRGFYLDFHDCRSLTVRLPVDGFHQLRPFHCRNGITAHFPVRCVRQSGEHGFLRLQPAISGRSLFRFPIHSLSVGLPGYDYDEIFRSENSKYFSESSIFLNLYSEPVFDRNDFLEVLALLQDNNCGCSELVSVLVEGAGLS